MKKIFTLLTVLCLLFSLTTTSFADSSQDELLKLNPQDSETIQIYDGQPAVGIKEKSAKGISSRSVDYWRITPIFVRQDLNSTVVQTYLLYEGTTPANSIKFSSFKLKDPSFFSSHTYHSFTPKVYSFGEFSNRHYVYLGEVSIPINITSLKISDSNLQSYHVDGWMSYTNIIGSFPIEQSIEF